MTGISEGTVDANGLRFGYLTAGESGPLALCLHGFPDSAWTWRHLLPRLAEAGYRAVAPWLRGYAPTQVPDDGVYQSAMLGLDAGALHTAFDGDGDAVLVGHDWGALASYAAVHDTVGGASRWRRLVTLAVPPPGAVAAGFLSYDQLQKSWYMFFFQHPLAEMAVAMADLEFVDRLWADWSPGYTPEPEEWEALLETFRAPGVLSAALGYYRTALAPASGAPERVAAQARATTENVPVETLYLHGLRDGCIASSLCEGLEEAHPKGLRMELVPEAGHFLHLEQPERVNAAILDFLSR